MKEVTLRVGEEIRLVVHAEFADPTVYSVTTPVWQQDDGMGGCLIFKVVRAWGSESEMSRRISCWGSNREPPEWGDSEEAYVEGSGYEPPEIPPWDSIIVGPAYP